MSDAGELVARGDASLLRRLTPARVSLATAGSSLATGEVLDFALAHALARDAVSAALDTRGLMEELGRRGLEAVRVQSAAGDRATYVRRPDLGRRLDEASGEALRGVAREDGGGPRLSLIVADGLSALAANRHAMGLIDALLPRLEGRFSLTAVVVAEQARVALGDEIGELLGGEVSLILIGERPGLSSPDSLGAYLTWGPRLGRTDAERNCVSNIRGEGLDYETAAGKLAGLMLEASERGLTGVGLKESAGELQG